MSEWSETKLSALGTIKRGKSKHRPRYAFHLYGGKYPFIQTGDVKAANKYITEFSQTYSEAGLAQSKLWPKGTLCITIAANIAETAILSFDACFPDSVIGFIPDSSKCNIDFIFYLLNHYQKELKELGIGSVQDNLNLESFEKITFSVPNLKEQQSIAETLSSLDEKIDLLHRQNKTLEQMAETLFRGQFKFEIETYKKCSLSELVTVIDNRGKTPPFTELPTNYPIIEVNALTGKARVINYDVIKKYVEKNVYETWFRSGHPKINDILLSTVGSIGEMAMFLENNGTIAQNVVALRSKNISPFYLYQYLTSIQDEIKEFDIGSVQPSIKVSQLIKLDIPIPPQREVEVFDSHILEISGKIKANDSQIKVLENLRDTLLPKLMNGTVRVINN